MKLSVVIPAHNEEKRIAPFLSKLGKAWYRPVIEGTDINKDTIEIIIVINNTNDRTIDIVKSYQKKYPFISYLNIPYITKKGGAIALGFEQATGDYIAYADADGSSGPSQILKLYNELKRDSDLAAAIGSRYIKGGTILGHLPLSRRIFSRLFNLCVRIGFGLDYLDTQCGYKIFRKDVAKEFTNKVSIIGWTFDLNLLLMAKYFNYTVKEVPIIWRNKRGSTLNTKKALLSVPRELITLKQLETKYIWNSFIERTFKTGPLSKDSSVLFLTKDNLWENKNTKTILKKLSRSYGVHVFMPTLPNRNLNERVGAIQFTRRGNKQTYQYWFALYYPIFFKRITDFVIPWNAGRLFGLRPATMPSVVIEIKGPSLQYKNRSYTLTYENLKRILEIALPGETIMSEKYYPWNEEKVEVT